MFAVIDCGSMNTRVYLIKNEQVIGKSQISVGVKDTAATGSKEKLKAGIKEAFSNAAAAAGVSLEEIEYAVASGMITSEIGLLEIPHLTAPVSIEDLAAQAKIVRDTDIFPLPMPVLFIRGIKNDAGSAEWDSIRKIDLMRGEETQAVGLLTKFKGSLPLNILELGSTTKLIHIDKEGRIAGSITTLSGQVYEAVKKETFIGGCVKETGTSDDTEEFFSEEVFKRAYDCVQKSGFLRTLLFTRFIQFALPTTAAQRKFFMEAAIAADDAKVFTEARAMGFQVNADFILVGSKGRCRLYEMLIKRELGAHLNITAITERQDIDMLTVHGAVQIAAKARTNKLSK